MKKYHPSNGSLDNLDLFVQLGSWSVWSSWCCRVGAVLSAWYSSCVLGWICAMQILRNLSRSGRWGARRSRSWSVPGVKHCICRFCLLPKVVPEWCYSSSPPCWRLRWDSNLSVGVFMNVTFSESGSSTETHLFDDVEAHRVYDGRTHTARREACCQ